MTKRQWAMIIWTFSFTTNLSAMIINASSGHPYLALPCALLAIISAFMILWLYDQKPPNQRPTDK